jgi:cbb3-type cytochrome oxidase maturation protein
MSSLLILVPLSLLLVGLAVWAFFWATNNGQFDDLDTPAISAILDDESAPAPTQDPPEDAPP